MLRVRVTKAPARLPRGRPSRSALEALADRMSAVVAVDLRRGVEQFRATSSFADMARAVFSKDYRKVVEAVPWEKLDGPMARGLSRLADAVSGASERAAAEVASATREVVRPKELSLGPDNPKIDRYLSVRTGELVERVTEDSQVAIQAAVRAGLEARSSPREIAGQVRQSIGLNTRQAAALQNYRAQLTADGTAPARLEKLVAAYGERLLDQRAQAIARTEVAYAQNQGQLEAWQEAKKRGYVGDAAGKRWVVDGDPCPICIDLNGQVVGMDESFETMDGDTIEGPPAHPCCRCALALAMEGA